MRLRLAHHAALSACVASIIVAAAAVQAQSFVGVGPVRSFVLPTEPRGEPTPEPAVIAPPIVAAAPRDDGLRRLPMTLKGFRFTGEWAQNQWPVHLTAQQAREPARFRLAFLSAISVMPEGSQATLSINGAVIARTALAPPDAVATRDFAVPAGLLKPGFNAVRLLIEQRHRVDCSPAATYELWTALDAAQTGLLLGHAGGFSTPADIAAVPPRRDGANAIRLLLAGKLSPEMAGRAVRAAQIAALAGRSLQPVVDIAGAEPESGGLALAIGTAEELLTRPELADLGAVAGPRYGFLPAAAGRGPRFVVTGNSAADLDVALARWNAERLATAATGSEAGLQAAALLPGHAASGASERIALRQTGFSGAEFSGRLFRLGLDIAMPMDFLPADYDRMALNLAGSHSADLGRQASILVEVNGHAAATQMLRAGAADDLERNQIFLPLRLLKPGQNRIEILAQTPTQADETCQVSRASSLRRLQILDRSELVLPRIARIGRAPELSLLAAGGFPFSREGAKPVLFVPNPDRQTMAAALTLAARLAVAAGRPIDFSFAMTPPARDAGEVLMVSPAPKLEPALLRAAGVDPAGLESAWRNGAQPGAYRPVSPASDAEALAQRCALPQAVLQTTVLKNEAHAPAASLSLASLGLRASLPALPFWAPAEPGAASSEAEVVQARAALIVGQDFPDAASRNLWTVVTAPDAAALKAGVECLTHPQIWSRLGGRLAALNADESVIALPAGERLRHVATQGFDVLNLRLVAAGWLSLNPLAYVGLVLALVLCLAAATLWLVLNTGRRQE
jgi:hypothetical protein